MSDTNLPTQSQKKTKSLKFRIGEENGLGMVIEMKTKAAISYKITAQLICVFDLANAKTCFLITWLILLSE